MSSEGRKWVTPGPDYQLKSDKTALCEAVVEEFKGKSFGEFYVTFFSDLGERLKKYGERTIISEKQMSVIKKVELNVFPEGFKAPEPIKNNHKYQPIPDDNAADVPF